MKKLKQSMLAATLLLAVLLSGCSKLGDKSGKESPPPEFDVYLQLGETFEVYPSLATGKLLCTVTNARVVTEESECPPYEWFVAYKLTAVIDGKEVYYRYPDFFVEGGAFDRGCRIILVDVTVENVDAKGLPEDEGGHFASPYAFYASHFFNMGDKSVICPSPEEDIPSMYLKRGPMCFSLANQYSEGEYTDPCAIEIRPGEKVSYTLGYAVHTKPDGSPQDLSAFYLEASVGEEYEGEYGLTHDLAHIELGLGAE